jgi:peptidoglycan-N-acetylglucosamine deacetylase
VRHAIIIAMLLGGSLVAAQQAPPRTPGDQQPGRKWTEDQLKQYSGAIRAGRKLTPKVWPDGARVAVALTFTVNNTAANLARGDSAVVQLTGGEFGAIVGLPRVLEVLDRHGVPATFFIPATAAIVDPQMIPEIVKRGRHEIGAMGWSDENTLAIDNAAEEERLLMKAVEHLTKASGVRPIGARGPSSIASLHTHGILARNGFLYDSTLAAMDEPYELLLNGRTSRLIELPISRILDDQPALSAPRFGPAALPSPELVFEAFRDDFDAAYREGTMFLLTLHPHLVGMRSRIGYLDDLIGYIKSKPNVWFATGGQIASYLKQQASRADALR